MQSLADEFVAVSVRQPRSCLAHIKHPSIVSHCDSLRVGSFAIAHGEQNRM